MAGIHPPSYYGMGKQEVEMMMEQHFAMTHGIFPTPQVGSLFDYMGTPKQLIFQPLSVEGDAIHLETAKSLPAPEQGES